MLQIKVLKKSYICTPWAMSMVLIISKFMPLCLHQHDEWMIELNCHKNYLKKWLSSVSSNYKKTLLQTFKCNIELCPSSNLEEKRNAEKIDEEKCIQTWYRFAISRTSKSSEAVLTSTRICTRIIGTYLWTLVQTNYFAFIDI